jgi:hypothetical protein
MPGPCTTRKSCVASTARPCVKWRRRPAPTPPTTRKATNLTRAGPCRTSASTSTVGTHRDADCRHLRYGSLEMKTGFIMISKLVSTAAAAALAVIVSMPAQAGEIDVAVPTGSLTFTAAGMNTLEVSSSGLSGSASYVSGSPSSDSFGSAAFGLLDFFTGPEVASSLRSLPPISCSPTGLPRDPTTPSRRPTP